MRLRSKMRADALYASGVALKEQGRFDEAIVHLDQCLQLQQYHVEAISTRLHCIWMQRTLADLRGLEERLVNEPYDVNLLRQCAEIESYLGRTEKSIVYYDRCVQLDPGNLRLYIYRGQQYRKSGRLNEAIADYNKGIQLWPKCAWLFINRAKCFMAKGEILDAIMSLDSYLGSDTEVISLRRAWQDELASHPPTRPQYVEKKDGVDKMTCGICFEQMSNGGGGPSSPIVLQPCGHCCCKTCNALMPHPRKCHMCRQPITGSILLQAQL